MEDKVLKEFLFISKPRIEILCLKEQLNNCNKIDHYDPCKKIFDIHILFMFTFSYLSDIVYVSKENKILD